VEKDMVKVLTPRQMEEYMLVNIKMVKDMAREP